jgi:general secretion pathway protein H
VRAKGFTLVELLVVLVILALLLGLVMPFLGGGARAELQSATNRVAAGLREARSRAIRDGKTAIFVVDGARGRFGILAGDAPLQQLGDSLRLGLLAADADTLEPGRGIIRFFADGSSTGGVVGLVRGEKRENVAIDWLTGRVAITE